MCTPIDHPHRQRTMKILRAIVVYYSFFISFTMKGEKVMAVWPDQFSAIYNFGDSNSDTGAMSAAFFPDVYPYGVTFFKRPSGRSSDGRLIIDFIAEKLKIPYLSAYLDSIGTNFKRGANFAAYGALVRTVNESFLERGLSPFSLNIQIEQFAQFQNRSILFYQRDIDPHRLPAPNDFAKALYIIDIGQTDISSSFAAMQSDQQIVDSFPYIVDQIASAVKKLYQLDARTFWIFNIGPIGCLPISRNQLPYLPPEFLDSNNCIKSQNDVTIEFNRQLKDKVFELRKQLNKSLVVYIDIYTPKYRLIANASDLGFSSPSEICWDQGSKYQIPTMTNGSYYVAYCKDPSKVISWDGTHETEASNSYVASEIFSDYTLSDPPI